MSNATGKVALVLALGTSMLLFIEMRKHPTSGGANGLHANDCTRTEPATFPIWAGDDLYMVDAQHCVEFRKPSN